MPLKIPYLFDRDGTYYFRRRVPDRFRALTGCHEWKLSLGKGVRDEAQLLYEMRALTAATDQALADLKRGKPVSPELLTATFEALYPELRSALFPTVSELAKAYQRARGIKCLAKPEDMATAQFIEFAGDLRLDRIDRKKVKAWLRWLADKRGQGAATVKRRLASMSAMASSAIDEEELDIANPFSRHRVRRDEDGFREPFRPEHLQDIRRWTQGDTGTGTSALIVRLLYATGARPLEIGGLEADDLRLEAEIPHLLIRANDQRGLKTASSRRLVPLVSDGLTAARAALARRPTGALFPPTCHETGSLSARLNKAIRAAGVPKSRKLTAYSFRHTMAEAMRITEAPYDVQQAILGHAKVSITERYGARSVSLARQKAALEKVMVELVKSPAASGSASIVLISHQGPQAVGRAAYERKSPPTAAIGTDRLNKTWPK